MGQKATVHTTSNSAVVGVDCIHSVYILTTILVCFRCVFAALYGDDQKLINLELKSLFIHVFFSLFFILCLFPSTALLVWLVRLMLRACFILLLNFTSIELTHTPVHMLLHAINTQTAIDKDSQCNGKLNAKNQKMGTAQSQPEMSEYDKVWQIRNARRIQKCKHGQTIESKSEGEKIMFSITSIFKGIHT